MAKSSLKEMKKGNQSLGSNDSQEETMLEWIIRTRYEDLDKFAQSMQILFEVDSWKFSAPAIYKLISLEELATLLGPSQEYV